MSELKFCIFSVIYLSISHFYVPLNAEILLTSQEIINDESNSKLLDIQNSIIDNKNVNEFTKNEQNQDYKTEDEINDNIKNENSVENARFKPLIQYQPPDNSEFKTEEEDEIDEEYDIGESSSSAKKLVYENENDDGNDDSDEFRSGFSEFSFLSSLRLPKRKQKQQKRRKTIPQNVNSAIGDYDKQGSINFFQDRLAASKIKIPRPQTQPRSPQSPQNPKTLPQFQPHSRLASETLPCLEIWSSWTAMALCQRESCGACDRQIIRRRCLSEDSCPCSGPTTRTEICSRQICPEPRSPCCSGFEATIYESEVSCQQNAATINKNVPPSQFNQLRSERQEPCCADLRGTWSSWILAAPRCSDECGGFGRQPRKRICLSTQHGCPCIGNSDEIIACNLRPCQFPRQTCAPGLRVEYRQTKSSMTAICVPPISQTASQSVGNRVYNGLNVFQTQEQPNIRNFAHEDFEPHNFEKMMTTFSTYTLPEDSASNIKLFMDQSMNELYSQNSDTDIAFDEEYLKGGENQFDLNMNTQIQDANFEVDENYINSEASEETEPNSFFASELFNDNQQPQIKEYLENNVENFTTKITQDNESSSAERAEVKSESKERDIVLTSINSNQEEHLNFDNSSDNFPQQNNFNTPPQLNKTSGKRRKKRQTSDSLINYQSNFGDIIPPNTANSLNTNLQGAIPRGLNIPSSFSQPFSTVQQDQVVRSTLIGVHPGQLQWRKENQAKILASAAQTPQVIPLGGAVDDIAINPLAETQNTEFAAAQGSTAPQTKQNQPVFLALAGQGRIFRDVVRGRSTTILPGLLVLRRQMNTGENANDQIRIPSDALSPTNAETSMSVPPLQLQSQDLRTDIEQASRVQNQKFDSSMNTAGSSMFGFPSIQPISTNEVLTQPNDFYKFLRSSNSLDAANIINAAGNEYIERGGRNYVHSEEPTVYYPIDDESPTFGKYYEIVSETQVNNDGSIQYDQKRPSEKENENNFIENEKTESLKENTGEFIDENGIQLSQNTIIQGSAQTAREKRSTRTKRQQNLANLRLKQFVQNLRRQLNARQQNNVSTNTTVDNSAVKAQGETNSQKQSDKSPSSDISRKLRVSAGESQSHILPYPQNYFQNIDGGDRNGLSQRNSFDGQRFNTNGQSINSQAIISNNMILRQLKNNIYGGTNTTVMTPLAVQLKREPNTIVEGGLRSNVIGNNPISNNFANTIGSSLGNNLGSNTIGNIPIASNLANTIGSSFGSNLGRNVGSNTIGNIPIASNVANTIGNTIGNNIGGNTNGNGFGTNVINNIEVPPITDEYTSDPSKQRTNTNIIPPNLQRPSIPTAPIQISQQPSGSQLADSLAAFQQLLRQTSARNQASSSVKVAQNQQQQTYQNGQQFQLNGILSRNEHNINTLLGLSTLLQSQQRGNGFSQASPSGGALTAAQLLQIQSALALSNSLNGKTLQGIVPQQQENTPPNIFIINRSPVSIPSNESPRTPQKKPIRLIQTKPGVFQFEDSVENIGGDFQINSQPRQFNSNSGFEQKQFQQQNAAQNQRRPNCCVPGGIWDLWTEWSPCEAECGGCASRTRTRRCASLEQGCPCDRAELLSRQSEVCNLTPCTFPRSACCGTLRPKPAKDFYICG